jgi:hypothetical protein
MKRTTSNSVRQGYDGLVTAIATTRSDGELEEFAELAPNEYSGRMREDLERLIELRRTALGRTIR